MEGQDLVRCWERAWRTDPQTWKGPVLCVLSYETKVEENTWNSEARAAGGGGRDVATAAYEMWARFIKEFADLPLGPVCPDFEQYSGAQQHGTGLTHRLKSWLKAP